MSTTLTEYRASVRHMVGTKGTRRHGDTDVDRCINRGVEQVFSMLKGLCCSTTVLIDTTIADRSYDLDTEFPNWLSIESVYYDQAQDGTYKDKVYEASIETMNAMIADRPNTQGTPESYATEGNTMFIFPLLSATGTSYLRVKGHSRPTVMTLDTSESGMDIYCDNAVELYASARILRADRRRDESEDYMQEFWVSIKNLQKTYNIRNRDGAAVCDLILPRARN